MPANAEKSRRRKAIDRLTARVDDAMRDASRESREMVTPLPGLTLLHHRSQSTAEATLYRPLVCLILRGKKETLLAGETARVGAGEALLVSHDLPIAARILEAPYTALVFEVDVSTLRSLYDEVGEVPPGPSDGSALQVCDPEVSLVEALERYLALLGSSADARVLGPLVQREIHYRLLVAPFGAMLRGLIRYDSHASAISRAIATLRRDVRAPMPVAKLAREVGMSVSAFHKHFKAVTSSSPLQYQKDLRLLEARRRLASGSVSVTAVAYEVGYESPSQFSREYTRKFGRPPSHEPSAAPRPEQASRALHLPVF